MTSKNSVCSIYSREWCDVWMNNQRHLSAASGIALEEFGNRQEYELRYNLKVKLRHYFLFAQSM